MGTIETGLDIPQSRVSHVIFFYEEITQNGEY